MKPLPFLPQTPAAEVPVHESTPAEVPVRLTPAVRDRRRPAVIVPVQHTDPELLVLACREIAASGIVDVIEWRIDPLAAAVGTLPSGRIDADALTEALTESAPHVTSPGLPVLVTLRSGFEGGEIEVGEEDYAEVVRRVIEVVGAAGRDRAAEIDPLGAAAGVASPEGAAVAIDVEIARVTARDLIAQAHARGAFVVASRHNFEATDSVGEMLATLSSMREAGADVAKIAMMPRRPEDVTDVLRATAEADARLDCPVLGIAMGEEGRTSRILGGDFGSCATFAQLGAASAPGQIDAARLATMFTLLYR